MNANADHARPNSVNPGLTPDREPEGQPVSRSGRPVGRRRTPVENTDYAAFAGRVIRAHARRIAEGDVDGLTDLVDWQARWTAATQTAVC